LEPQEDHYKKIKKQLQIDIYKKLKPNIMSCGCGQANHEQIPQMTEYRANSEPDSLTGRTIKHSTGKILTISAPIRDVNGSLIGYITNDQDGKVMRIFSKDVSEVL
jgi:hypothetical protein